LTQGLFIQCLFSQCLFSQCHKNRLISASLLDFNPKAYITPLSVSSSPRADDESPLQSINLFLLTQPRFGSQYRCARLWSPEIPCQNWHERLLPKYLIRFEKPLVLELGQPSIYADSLEARYCPMTKWHLLREVKRSIRLPDQTQYWDNKS
jgi:hypothetical protein